MAADLDPILDELKRRNEQDKQAAHKILELTGRIDEHLDEIGGIRKQIDSLLNPLGENGPSQFADRPTGRTDSTTIGPRKIIFEYLGNYAPTYFTSRDVTDYFLNNGYTKSGSARAQAGGQLKDLAAEGVIDRRDPAPGDGKSYRCLLTMQGMQKVLDHHRSLSVGSASERPQIPLAPIKSYLEQATEDQPAFRFLPNLLDEARLTQETPLRLLLEYDPESDFSRGQWENAEIRQRIRTAIKLLLRAEAAEVAIERKKSPKE